jgi:hypothetical protein
MASLWDEIWSGDNISTVLETQQPNKATRQTRLLSRPSVMHTEEALQKRQNFDTAYRWTLVSRGPPETACSR